MADRAHSTSRRALLAGLSVTPLLSSPAMASADPHAEARLELLRLWREHKLTVGGWEHPFGSAACEAASDAHYDLVTACMAVTELPPPRTLEGLGVVALAVALAFEGHLTEEAALPDQAFHRLLTATLSATDATLPDDWRGMVYQIGQAADEQQSIITTKQV